MKNINSDFISGVFLIIISLIIIFYMIPNSVASNPIPALSSAFFPKILTYVMILLVIILLIQSFKKDNNNEYKKENEINGLIDKSFKKIVLINLVLFTYLFLLNNFGYIISTPIFLFLLLYVFGEKKVVTYIIFPISMTFAIYMIFSMIMKIKLP